MDKNKKALNELEQIVTKKGLSNVEIIKLNDNTTLSISNNSIDIILLYDVLHLVENRKSLFEELYRILRSNGILSVYPKHHDTEMGMDLKDVIREIESNSYIFDEKLLKLLMHCGQLERGYVFNFRKSMKRLFTQFL